MMMPSLSISVCMCIIIKIIKQNFVRDFPHNSTNYVEINIYYETILGVCIDTHTHTHTHIYMYIYINVCTGQFNRSKIKLKGKKKLSPKNTKFTHFTRNFASNHTNCEETSI